MRRRFWSAALCVAVLGLPSFAPQAADDDDLPRWAYAVPKYPALAYVKPPPSNEPLQRVPGSSLELTVNQTKDMFNAPDWHPDSHPPAPEVVLRCSRRNLEACAHCHLANGQGSNILQAPSLAGLSVSYMMQQFADYKDGARKSAVLPYGGPATMKFVLNHADEADFKAAAEYFATVKLQPWFRVVETARVAQNIVRAEMTPPVAPEEPIGMPIFEFPEDIARAGLRDSASGFIAYVPPGSMKKGEALVTTGGKGLTTACLTCHGHGLRGLGPVPALAGRSPTYIVRELYNMQQGARTSPWSALMAPVVSKLTLADMVATAAYTASREP